LTGWSVGLWKIKTANTTLLCKSGHNKELFCADSQRNLDIVSIVLTLHFEYKQNTALQAQLPIQWQSFYAYKNLLTGRP